MFAAFTCALVLGKSATSKGRNKELRTDQKQVYERSEHRKDMKVVGDL